MNRNLIFDIKRYSINDGPGIRITLFLKGCPLSCVWCHNPEGISPHRQKLYTRKKCIGCRSCVDSCPQQALRLTPDGIVCDDTRCVLCGKCAGACPTLALEISGTAYTPEALMREIAKETTVMDHSGGGVTFCGGEPLLYPDFLLDLLQRCGRQGIHRAVDTTLFARPEVVTAVADHCELMLVDLKTMDSAWHKQLCGVPNERILSNLRLLAEKQYPFWVRVPLIAGVNADEENITHTAAFLAGLPWTEKKVDLLSYHDIGAHKHEKLGTSYNPGKLAMEPPSEEEKLRAVAIFESYGLNASLGG